MAGPEGADLTRCVVAHGDDQVHVRRAGGGDACVARPGPPQRVWLLVVARAAARRVSLEAALAHGVEQSLCQDAAGGVVRAQKQHVQRSAWGAHFRPWLSSICWGCWRWGRSRRPGRARGRTVGPWGSTRPGRAAAWSWLPAAQRLR